MIFFLSIHCCVLILQYLVILYENNFTCLPFFSYTIQDLSMEKEFVVDLDISICFEANGPCVFNSNILKSARLPKPLCNLNSNMSFGGLYTLILYWKLFLLFDLLILLTLKVK